MLPIRIIILLQLFYITFFFNECILSHYNSFMQLENIISHSNKIQSQNFDSFVFIEKGFIDQGFQDLYHHDLKHK